MTRTFFISIVSILVAGVCVGAFLFFANRVSVFHDRAVAVHNSVVLVNQKATNVDMQRRALREIDQSGINLDAHFFDESDALSLIEMLEHAGAAH